MSDEELDLGGRLDDLAAHALHVPLLPPETVRAAGDRRRHRRRAGAVLASVAIVAAGAIGAGVSLRGGSLPASPAVTPGTGGGTHGSSPSTTAPVPVSSADLRLTTTAFLSPTDGYGLFVPTGFGGECGTSVGHSTDGGAHFALVTVPMPSCAGTSASAVAELAFDDHGDGFLYGPGLFVTHDDGASWSLDAHSGSVLAVEALGSSVWMVETDCHGVIAPPTGECPVKLLESADGGRTWKPSAAAPTGITVSVATATVGPEPAQGQTWLVRTGPSSAYLVSDPTKSANGSASIAEMLYTSDGGASWVARTVPCGESPMSVVESAAPDGTLVAVCAAQPEAGFQQKSIEHSSDGGQTWLVHAPCTLSPSVSSACSSDPLMGGYLGGLDAVSSRTAFIVGGRSPLKVTHDGGAHWQSVASVGGNGGSTSQVVFFSAQDGLVLGESASGVVTIWHTSDGGSRWTAVVPQVTVPSTAVSTPTTAPPSTTTTPPATPSALPVVTCPTTVAIAGAPPSAHLPATKTVAVPPALAGALAVYVDSQGVIRVVAPRGWSCTALRATDGSGNVKVYPPGTPPPTTGDPGSAQAVVASETSACALCTLGQACPLFPAALSALHAEYPTGPPCRSRPAAESVTQVSGTVVGFEDPPGTTGDGSPSGGTNPANGVMTYSPSSPDGSWLETCTLPASEHQTCTTILDDFATRYGTK